MWYTVAHRVSGDSVSVEDALASFEITALYPINANIILFRVNTAGAIDIAKNNHKVNS